jgi:peptidyl-prolyl cis-trans isomerase A (cyclophilin A)
VEGFVSFAASGANTRTTQVYINLGDNSRLDRTGFAPIGKVATGMDIVRRLCSEYGEGSSRGKGPEQRRISAEGEAYLARDFPKLDRIVRARIIG